MTSGSAAARAAWQDKDVIEPTLKEDLRPVVELKNARLCSFWIE